MIDYHWFSLIIIDYLKIWKMWITDWLIDNLKPRDASACKNDHHYHFHSQMLRTVDQQLGVVHRQIADINRRISQWEGGDNEEDFEEEEVGDVEEEEEADDVEEEEEEERGTILDLGDGNLINKDWNNTTVSEEVSSIYLLESTEIGSLRECLLFM